MISIITPIYNTKPAILARTWRSITSQTYTDWEWIVWDDSPNEYAWRQAYGYCADERYKIRMFRTHVPSGIIGNVKRQAFMVADGNILVELDHDDELMPDALAEINAAFEDKSVGFVYSNWCEIDEYNQSCKYPEGWAFGYGSEYADDENKVWVMRAPELNATTMGHIVSAPNHVRAWRSSVYHKLNGHNPELRVADDYELCVRTVLETNTKHIDKLLYKQHINSGTAQRVHNAEIQENVRIISDKYRTALEKHYESV